MLKSELVQRVADKNPHLHRSDIEKVVNTVAARPARNPKTGELVSVPETAHAAFKTGIGMHRRLNADFQ